MKRRPHGEDHPMAKLTEKEVIELREKWDALEGNLVQYGEPMKGYQHRFCNYHCSRVKNPVTYQAIYLAITRRDWLYLEEENQ